MLKQPVPYNAIVHQTEKAFLIRLADKQVWLPKAQVTLALKGKTVHVPTWLVKKLALTTTIMPKNNP